MTLTKEEIRILVEDELQGIQAKEPHERLVAIKLILEPYLDPQVNIPSALYKDIYGCVFLANTIL